MKARKIFSACMGMMLTLAILVSAAAMPASALAVDSKPSLTDGVTILDKSIIEANKDNLDTFFKIGVQSKSPANDNYVKWVGGALEFKSDSNGNSIVMLKKFPQGLTSYTVEADIVVPTLASNTLLSLGINSNAVWTRGYFFQYKNGANRNMSLNNSDGSNWGVKSTVTGKIDYAYSAGSVMTLKITVTPEKVVSYLNGAEIGFIATKDLSTNDGCPAIGLRGKHTVKINDFKVYTGVGAKDDLKQVAFDTNTAFLGHQRTVNANEKFGLRFISQVKDTAGFTEMGFDITVTDSTGKVVKQLTRSSKTVYEKINGTVDGETKQFTANGDYKYLCALTITDIPANLGELKFNVTPFSISESGVYVYYAPYAVNYNGALAVA